MTGSRRSLVTAILATLAALGFAFSVFAITSTANFSSNSEDDAVTYTFVSYHCVGSAPEQQLCGWSGTVTSNGIVEQTGVTYRDTIPVEVSRGYQVPALWSYRDPLNAWSIEGSQAWLNTLANTGASFTFFVIMAIVAIYWWRRFVRDRRDESQAASDSAPPQRSKGSVSA